MAPGLAILTLKFLVVVVTLLLLASLIALAYRQPRWHGRINTVFFVLTATTLVGFEVLIRLINPELTAGFSPQQRESLQVHLSFAIPSAILLPLMLLTGTRGYRRLHIGMAILFLILWAGTFVTGVFYLPHNFENA